jgi:acetylornithine deacetylase/succinyl-diaminopimelate desuccinylase-like protein
MEAGHAENALPQTVRTTVNCRILPDQPVEEVIIHTDRALVAAVLAGHEQATDTVPAHAAERHRADWFVIPGHAGIANNKHGTQSSEIAADDIRPLRRVIVGAHCLRFADPKSHCAPAARRCWRDCGP